MDFGFAAVSLVVQTGYALAQHRQLLDTEGDNTFIQLLETLIPTRLGFTTDLVSDDISILCSTCMTSGLLTSIYQQGRGEKLHAPLFVAIVVGTLAMWRMLSVQVDILALTIFQWMLALAMLISRCYEHLNLADREVQCGFSCSAPYEKAEYGEAKHKKSVKYEI
ncbi:hypothetical protein BDZ45DRAFT_795868 [Acephala macrosclerotiorum]|nr:hypothetical protein BDZ45DRAFT_795868 [Acephala macrosclerotiorum]